MSLCEIEFVLFFPLGHEVRYNVIHNKRFEKSRLKPNSFFTTLGFWDFIVMERKLKHLDLFVITKEVNALSVNFYFVFKCKNPLQTENNETFNISPEKFLKSLHFEISTRAIKCCVLSPNVSISQKPVLPLFARKIKIQKMNFFSSNEDIFYFSVLGMIKIKTFC